MPRHKDMQWNLPEGSTTTTGSRSHLWESIHAALLMDIRDELKRMNEILHCSNFLNIPRELRSIRLNTAKKRKRSKA